MPLLRRQAVALMPLRGAALYPERAEQGGVSMLVLKGCTRCCGDLYVERGIGLLAELVCLQCGRRKPVLALLRRIPVPAA